MSSDQRVYGPTDSLYVYPAIVVVCDPNQYHDALPNTLTNPLLLVEVLSPGTAAYNRATSVGGDKFALYRHSDTLQEYLVVNSEKVSAELWRKHKQGYWFLASDAQHTAGSIELASIGLILSEEMIYAETDGIRF